MSDFQDDQKIQKGPRESLKDNKAEGLKVVAPLRDQISQDLMTRLKKKGIGQKVREVWQKGNSDRSEWLERQREYLEQVDEFIDPIYTPATDWGSDLHLPTILTVGKTFHARMFAAITSIDPMFTVKARKGANADKATLIQELMRYTTKEWINFNQGIEAELDAWVWDWVFSGIGILKAGWLKKYTRFVDVETRLEPKVVIQDGPEGSEVAQEMTEEEVAVLKTELVYEGPELRRVNIEDVLIIGGTGDPQKAEHIMHREPLTASMMNSLVDQKIFDKEAVDLIIAGGPSSETSDIVDGIKQQRKVKGGQNDLESSTDHDKYNIIESYLSLDVTDTGIDSDVIVWVHQDTGEIVRATYLYRVMKTGMKPFFKIGFHKRFGSDQDVGLVELLFSLGKEIDAIHNMKIDTGLITSLPWGFYKPTNNLNEEKLPIEPGAMIPLNDPSRDVFFPNLGNRTSFGIQEEAALMNQVERLTSINDLSLGVLSGAQGATRTATGASLLAGETSANLDIFLRRMNRGWKQALQYTFQNLQQRIPEGLEFRVTDSDGQDLFPVITDRQQLAGMYDFDVDPNSANSNPTLQLQRANQIYQMTQNPIDLQLGLVGPRERYEAVRNLFMHLGVKDTGKYIREPAEVLRVFTPSEVANRILAGMDVKLDPTQDLQGFVELIDFFLSEDEILGQFGENEVAALVAKQDDARKLLAALQQAENDQLVTRQQDINTQANFGGEFSARVEADSNQGVLGE